MVRLNRRPFSTVQHNHARRQKFKQWIYNVLINATGCGMSRSRRILRNDEQKVKDTFNILVSIKHELALSTHPNPPRAVFALHGDADAPSASSFVLGGDPFPPRPRFVFAALRACRRRQTPITVAATSMATMESPTARAVMAPVGILARDGAEAWLDARV
jgi:hypothetical protein